MLKKSEKLKQLKIYYLFIHADGESSPKEMQYLNDIIENEDLSEKTIEKFQAFCGQMMFTRSSKNSDTVIAEIDDLLGENQSEFIYENKYKYIDTNKTAQAQTIWTLINLGYADSEYSEPEKKVVNHLIERWNMDPVLVSELNDTADTILALSQHKMWVQTTAKSQREIQSVIHEMDRNIASMFENVETTISEAGIA